MGKWRNHPSRRLYRQEKLPSPSPLPFHPQPPPPSGCWQDGIPYWEKQYCTLIGSIPWWKVVDSKNYMYGNNNVLSWDDSGGEEAFQNAKQRFWADINGLCCDISLPDPDIYIDEINWNPAIDSKLIKEVDLEYFAPDEEGDGEFGQSYKKTKYSDFGTPDGHNKEVPDNSTDPWECDNIQGSEDLKNKAQGRNQWEGNGDNPWERGVTQANRTTKKNTWEDSRDQSWGWNQKGDDISPLKDWDKGVSPWEHGFPGVSSVKCNRWGDPLSNSWGCNQHEPKNVVGGENPWECSLSETSKSLNDRGWRDRGRDEWGWKQRESHNNQRNNLEFRKVNRGLGARNEGVHKRERPHQYISGYQTSRFQGSDYQTSNCWNRGNNRKRVNFAFE